MFNLIINKSTFLKLKKKVFLWFKILNLMICSILVRPYGYHKWGISSSSRHAMLQKRLSQN